MMSSFKLAFALPLAAALAVAAAPGSASAGVLSPTPKAVIEPATSVEQVHYARGCHRHHHHHYVYYAPVYPVYAVAPAPLFWGPRWWWW